MTEKRPVVRKAKRGKWTSERIMLWGIIVLVMAIALLLWGPFKAKRTAEKRPPTGREQRDATRERTPGRPEITAVVAIVIDDLGQDLKQAETVMALPERVTLAVMPLLPQSRKIAELAQEKGREVIVHMPMEAVGRGEKRPTPGMLRAAMTPMEFISAVNDNLDAVPGAVGVNNHEGSSLTANRQAMTFLMKELQPRRLFFLDSLTDPGSTAYAVAKEFGLRAAKRDVFLDNESGKPAAIRKQLAALGRIAKEHGQAIGIGHPHPATLAELRKWLPAAAGDGIEVVPLSRLVN